MGSGLNSEAGKRSKGCSRTGVLYSITASPARLSSVPNWLGPPMGPEAPNRLVVLLQGEPGVSWAECAKH